MSFILGAALLLATTPDLTTVGEKSAFHRTGRYEEVERLCAAFAKAFPKKVRCERFGTTPEGRPMLALVASEAWAAKNPVVLLQGGIHAGEIDGKDAGFLLLRRLLEGSVDAGLLKRVTLVFVPVFNVDGHERFGPNHRPNQRGPEAMGWRVTAQNLNLNRDYAKAESPEMQAMLGLLQKYQPILYADLHVTDGAQFEHDIAVLVEPRFIHDSSLADAGRALAASTMSELSDAGHLPLDFYPSFEDEDDPDSGFSYGVAPLRFSTTYWALHHRFGVLVETHSWKPYAERVKATYDVCRHLLNEAAKHGRAWETLSAQDAARNTKVPPTQAVLSYDADEKSAEPFRFRGYAYERKPSDVSGKMWVAYDESRHQEWVIPLRTRVVPLLTVDLPKAGYIVPVEAAPWVAPKLAAHGIAFRKLEQRSGLSAQVFKVAEAKFGAAPYEGRMTVRVKGAWAAGTADIRPGALFVPLAQPLAVLVAQLFEPTGADSFMAWGYFNASLEMKEYVEDYVLEAFAREALRDEATRAAFQARLKEDGGFSKSPKERLDFFHRRHPARDVRFNVYPVVRVDEVP